MIWLSISTSKYLSADLKFVDNRKKAAEKKEEAAEEKPTNAEVATALYEMFEGAAWGL